MPTSPSSRAPTRNRCATIDVELLLNDAEERNGDGYRTRHAQGGSQETLTAADQSDGTEALDEAKPLQRRIHVAKEDRHEKIQRRPS
jgi:hypothetical protein